MKKSVVCDCRIYPESIKTLQNLGYNVVFMPKSAVLDDPVSAHPDMSLVKIADKYIIASDVHESFINFEDFLIYNREQSSLTSAILEYPDDVSLNCAVVGNRIICNKAFTSDLVLKSAKDNNFKIIDVKQGYTKCSIVVVDDNSIITEDRGIAKICNENGLDVLLLKEKISLLDGYNCGFIGGCTGKLSGGKIVFNGNIYIHPEYDKIKLFCNSRNVEVVSLCNKPLYDVGSIIEL